MSIQSKTEADFVFKLWRESLIVSSQIQCSLNPDPGHTFGPFDIIYIGLNDIENEGNFVWTDGSFNADYRDWGPGQPSNAGGNEDCSMWVHDSVDVTWKPWNDFPCDSATHYPYICKLIV